jgi:MFS family permease
MYSKASKGGRLLGYFELLRINSAIRMVWLGKLCSMLGDWISYVAVMGLVMDITGSGVVVAAVMISRALPFTLFGMVSGVLLDRIDRRTVLIYSDIIRALLAFGFLAVHSGNELWLVYLLGGAMQSLTAFFNPGLNAVIPSICHEKQIVTANALMQATSGAAMIVGSALGGVIISLTGRDWGFVMNGFSFIISAVCIWSVKISSENSRVDKESPFDQFREGIKFIKTNSIVFAIILRRMGERLGAGFNVMLPVYAVQIWNTGEKGIGILYSITGIGFILGSWVVKKHISNQGIHNARRVIGWGNVGEALFWIAFAFSPNLWVGAAMLAFMVACDIATHVAEVSMLQKIVPNRLLGRVFAARETLLTLAWTVALSVTGVILENWGPQRTATGIGSIILLTGICWFLSVKTQIVNANHST